MFGTQSQNDSSDSVTLQREEVILIPLVISPGTGVKGTDNTLLQFYYFI
jgi:hypothetical protein